MMAGLQSNLGRLQSLQEQLSSGRQINRPSDNPAGTVSAMQFRSEIARTTQYQRNCEDGLGWLGTADDILTSALEPMNRVRSLVMSGISGAASSESREALATEIDQLRENLLAVANTRYLGRPVFGGTTSNSEAYVKDTPTGAMVYNGDSGNVMRSIATNTTVAVNLQHDDVFGPAGSDVFSLLAQISNDLRTNPAGLSADLNAVDVASKRMQNALAEVGSRYHRVESMKLAAEASLVSLTTGLTDTESIDLPKTILDLKMQEVAYQAALGATARIIQPSLVDFLR
jgi:flagellar hook-associated protein 3 FlgL